MKTKLPVIIMFILVISSCSKKQEEKQIKAEEQIETEEETTTEVRKITFIDYDDTVFDDPGTIEFNLQNEKQNFCIGHSVKKIEDFDYENYIIVSEWNVGHEVDGWVKQEREDFTVMWTYPDGLVVYLLTTSPEWKTRRGIHVGSTRKEVEKAYEKDSDIQVYGPSGSKPELVQDIENELFWMNKSSGGLTINYGNLYSEEMMTMRLYMTDDIVTKIEIVVGN